MPNQKNDLQEWYKNHSIFDQEQKAALTKDKYEKLHDTSKFTSDFKVVFDEQILTKKEKNFKELKSALKETIAIHLTSDWGDSDLSPEDFYFALKEALIEEATWFEKHSKRCNDVLALVMGNRIVDLE